MHPTTRLACAAGRCASAILRPPAAASRTGWHAGVAGKGITYSRKAGSLSTETLQPFRV